MFLFPSAGPPSERTVSRLRCGCMLSRWRIKAASLSIAPVLGRSRRFPHPPRLFPPFLYFPVSCDASHYPYTSLAVQKRRHTNSVPPSILWSARTHRPPSSLLRTVLGELRAL